ncbi:MurR/RpiR family transcriptional regulator [Eubacterium sp.]|uniref:MurR/RpiR family transcriptional regulator n=1 Tax=Eubacterium sp. TaxID=142586 RepID=UPI00351FB2C4
MEKSVLNQICTLYDSFFETEKKIGDYIIRNPKDIVDVTVGELAVKCQVSEASISRFCKKIGLKGFHHLKISIAKELVNREDNEEYSNDISIDNKKQSLKSILANKVAELTQTVSMMDTDNLDEILNKINNARSVLFAAAGNTIPVAMDGAYKLNQIGIPAISTPVLETQLAYSYNLTADDVVIAISNSGESTGVINIIEAAKQNKAITISITNHDNSSIAKLSEYHITTASLEKMLFDEYCFSRVSATMVIEILYLFLTSMRKDAYKSIMQHEKSIAFTKE